MNFFEQYKDEIMEFFKAFYEFVVTLFGKFTDGNKDDSTSSSDEA